MLQSRAGKGLNLWNHRAAEVQLRCISPRGEVLLPFSKAVNGMLEEVLAYIYIGADERRKGRNPPGASRRIRRSFDSFLPLRNHPRKLDRDPAV